MSSEERAVSPDIVRLIEEWRAEVDLALETSEGHAWLAFWYTLHRVQKKTNELLDAEVHRGARLPVTHRKQSEITGSFEIPDAIPDPTEEE